MTLARKEEPMEDWTPSRLARVDELLAGSPPERLLEWAAEEFGPDIALATSFGPQSIVLMHLISTTRPEITIFYLDTDLLFEETHELREQLGSLLGVQFVRVPASLSLAEQAARHGEALWSRKPDLCCHLRKVLPLRTFLASRRAWITGIRREQTAARAAASRIEWDRANGLVKLNPLVHWTSDEVGAYVRRHGLPTNRLHLRGYPSIGCRPCTQPVAADEGARGGRWRGFGKTECGIHT